MIHSLNDVNDPLQRDCSSIYYSFLYLEWRVLMAVAPSRSLCSLKSNKRKAQANIMLYLKWGHEGTSSPVAFFGDGTSSPAAFFWYYFAFPHLSGRKSQITNLCLWITNTNEMWECSNELAPLGPINFGVCINFIPILVTTHYRLVGQIIGPLCWPYEPHT